jgi:uncharacterized protein YciI
MIVVHLAAVNSPEYFSHRQRVLARNLPGAEYGETYRAAHIGRCLAMRHVVLAAGPSPDGKRADVFYRVENLGELDALLRDDPYIHGRIWVDYAVHAFDEFLGPLGRVAPCFDGSRKVTAIEGDVVDAGHAIASLESIQREGKLVCGGLFAGNRGLVWINAADSTEAKDRVGDGGGWARDTLSSRAMVWVL